MIFSFLRSVHAWGGFLLSILILLVSITGTLLVWKREFLWVTIPQVRVDYTVTPASATAITLAAERAFGQDQVLLVAFGSQNLALNKVYLYDQSYAYLDMQGAVIDKWHLNGRPEEWLYDLHHRLLLSDTGLLIVGLAGLALLCLIPTGLIIWWPTRKNFRLSLWVRGLRRHQLLQTHRNLGIIAAVPIMVSLVTGVILTFPDQAQEIMVYPFTQSESYNELYVTNLDTISGPGTGDWLAAFTRAQASFPNAIIRSASPPVFVGSHRVIAMQKENDWHQGGLNRVYIDSSEGYMDMRLDASQVPISERLYNLSLPLHTGNIGSLAYKIALTLFGLSLFTLSLLGLTSFVKKLRSKTNDQT